MDSTLMELDIGNRLETFHLESAHTIQSDQRGVKSQETEGDLISFDFHDTQITNVAAPEDSTFERNINRLDISTENKDSIVSISDHVFDKSFDSLPNDGIDDNLFSIPLSSGNTGVSYREQILNEETYNLDNNNNNNNNNEIVETRKEVPCNENSVSIDSNHLNDKENIEYQYYLERSKELDFSEESKFRFLYRCGNDSSGRPVVVIVSANFPPPKSTDMERLLLYVIYLMDPIVNDPYILIYVQTNSSSGNSYRPSFKWLRKAYRILNRKYKKNLKLLYVVHPTLWVKAAVKFFKPFISNKFWQKLVYIKEINELFRFVSKDVVRLPEFVYQFESGKMKTMPIFGISLDEVLERNDHQNLEVPIVVEETINCLIKKQANKVEGIFRLSGNQQHVQQLKKAFDRGLSSLGLLIYY